MKRLLIKLMVSLLSLTLLSTMTVFAADTVGVSNPLEIESSIAEQTINAATLQDYSKISIPDEPNFVSAGIDTQTISQDITIMDDNQAPVADLRVTVLNPDSMVNGNFTTETQIAWLWSYNGENFTYDPDGDTITNMSIGGISNSDLVGTLTGNIGFVTQFQTAAQYQLTFQVQDSRGAWSNVAKYTFSIGPADGNTRPVCQIGITSNTLIPGQLMMISWANSYDNDAGDALTSVGSKIITDDGTVTSLNDYLVENDGSGCVVKFEETGTYEIWIRVCDSHNAWSNWFVFTVTVENVKADVTVTGTYEGATSRGYWVDNFKAKSIDSGAICEEDAIKLAELCGSHSYPSALPDKMLFDNSIEVSGRVTTASGAPVANTGVNIKMPLSFSTFYATVYTDSNGYFSYEPTATQFWLDTNMYQDPDQIDFLSVGDRLGDKTQYIYFSTDLGTSFFYPTTISVFVKDQLVHSERVTCEVGYSKEPRIGNSICHNGQWGGL